MALSASAEKLAGMQLGLIDAMVRGDRSGNFTMSKRQFSDAVSAARVMVPATTNSGRDI